jgi:hypothetical protein
MTEDQVRSIVRDVVRRRLAAQGEVPGAPISALGSSFESHPSHARFLIVRGGDGPCLIEPVVTCAHCGFCQSHGY